MTRTLRRLVVWVVALVAAGIGAASMASDNVPPTYAGRTVVPFTTMRSTTTLDPTTTTLATTTTSGVVATHLWTGHDYFWTDHDYFWTGHDYLWTSDDRCTRSQRRDDRAHQHQPRFWLDRRAPGPDVRHVGSIGGQVEKSSIL